MSRDPTAPPPPTAGMQRAWPIVIGGLAATLVALALDGLSNLDSLAGASFLMVRMPLAAAGLIAVGAGVVRRLRSAGQDFEERVESAGLIVVAAVAALVAAFSFDPWDSIQMFLGVAAAVTLFGAFLVLLPSVGRKVAISLVVLVHFANTVVSITTVPPANGQAPFLMVNAWAHAFRYYASFLYLNNAYHFYSPEPGPPTLLWFHIRYTDGSTRWIKIPDRAADPVPLHYQRMLALTESTNVNRSQLPADFNEIAYRHHLAAKRYKPEIPVPPDLAATMQYQVPEDYSKVMVSAYARYIARTYAHPEGEGTDPNAGVKGVKVYRVVHSIITAAALADGVSPFAKNLDYPYFQGEFDSDGKLKDERDPFLYWLVPITLEPEDPSTRLLNVKSPKMRMMDYLEVHANYEPPPAPAGEEKQP